MSKDERCPECSPSTPAFTPPDALVRHMSNAHGYRGCAAHGRPDAETLLYCAACHEVWAQGPDPRYTEPDEVD